MKTFLVAIDFSPVTQSVIDTAASLSRLAQAKIVLVHVVRPPVLVAEYGGALEGAAATLEASETAAARLLSHWESVLRQRKIPIKAIRLNGFPAGEILRQARKVSADMIVMGSHGHTAFYDLLIGGTSSGVLRKTDCPVVLVPAAVAPGRRRRKK
jgi:nucleotide-binding universal stress UspA family protein